MKPPSPLAPVPALRTDLVIGPRSAGVGAELIHVTPAGERDGTDLHGFELSLARMLDGRRAAGELIENADRLGMPLTLPSLDAFIRQLSAQGLLAHTAETADRGVSARAQRSVWDPLIRLQYQSALKAVRLGRLGDARARLERLMESAPQMEESLAMRAWMDAHPTGTSDGESFRETFRKAERGWFGWREALGTAELRAVRASWTPRVLLLGLLALGLTGMLLPTPHVLSVPAKLSPVTVSEVKASHGGVIDQVLVHDRQWVKRGAVLFTYGPPTAEAVTAPGEGAVADLRARSSSTVFAGQPLLALHDTRRLRVTAQLDAAQALLVRPGQTVTLTVGEHLARGIIAAVDHGEVVVEIDNAMASMEAGSVVVDIDVGSRSLIQRLK